ncbi:TIGR02710 family CRISPR-associated CARF protein [Desulfotomaculum copahuensis]|uniref:TIGR02710 family CRISPR-associated CARF protein n=1 Tax=Desulfotomaculum copahuensis TaxID=1838280 RepID=UPI000B0B5474|nr:TIGR02710 family CRISPR-associated CARF protein [Desulfotomaculum copahuensis]
MSNQPAKEEELKSRGERWRDWPRSSEEERKEAEEYYQREIMPLLIDVFVTRERPRVNKEYSGMILSLGTSFEPLVLSILALQPARVCFLCTEASRQYLDPVIQFTGLVPSCYEVRKVDKDNPLQIYQAIKEVYKDWGQPANIAVDFTGGTKAMSGGSAMAGGVIGAEMVYIASSNYLANLRRPFPGSEHLEFIPSPYQVFGDLEEEKAFGMLARYDYTSARRIFENLERQVPDPRRCRVLSLLCRAYEAWDNLDIPAARDNLTVLVESVRQYAAMQRDFILADKLPVLEFQMHALNVLVQQIEKFAKCLKEKKNRDSGLIVEILNEREFVLSLMFTLYCNARRREEQGKLDMASLLLYRLLELISQVRLAVHGLDTGAPDYSRCHAEELLSTLNSRYKNFNGGHVFHTLPEQISLFYGYLLLSAMKDELAAKVNLKSLRGQVQARNYNIFAHGFDFIGAEQCARFRELVEDLLEALLAVWGEDRFQLEEKFKFVIPQRG